MSFFYTVESRGWGWVRNVKGTKEIKFYRLVCSHEEINRRSRWISTMTCPNDYEIFTKFIDSVSPSCHDPDPEVSRMDEKAVFS